MSGQIDEIPVYGCRAGDSQSEGPVELNTGAPLPEDKSHDMSITIWYTNSETSLYSEHPWELGPNKMFILQGCSQFGDNVKQIGSKRESKKVLL